MNIIQFIKADALLCLIIQEGFFWELSAPGEMRV
jgi:hypothetical protein